MQVETWYSWWRGIVKYVLVRWSVRDRVDGGPVLQVMRRTNTLRGEWSEPHIGGRRGRKA